MEEINWVYPEIYQLLESADWNSLGKKMLARAIWRGYTRYHITPTTIFAGGCTVDDAISYIVQSVFEGWRRWEPDKDTLEDWLLDQVDSVMDWWLKLRENKNLSLDAAENSDEENRETDSTNSTEWEAVLKYGPPDPETILIDRFDEQEAKDLYEALYDDASGDPQLQEMILAMMDIDNPKPRIVADVLGVPVEDIYNRKKRLKHHLEKLTANRRKSLP